LLKENRLPNTQEQPTDAPPPHAQLIQMGAASWVSAVVYAAARLGLADQGLSDE
jgi:hypothetical protein